jgi:DNA-directed RNA polymerase III subunit RPC6
MTLFFLANRLAILSEDHILIYSLIENAGGAGQWMRPLEGKSGMHQSKVRKCLKDLMVHKIVIELKSADTSRKTYISADVKPDEKHIGGGWMDEGKFDEAMINVMTGLAVRFLVEKGWYMQETRTSDVADHSNPITAKHKSKTPAVVTIGDDNATPAPAPANPESKERRLIPAWTYKKHNLLPHHPNHYLRYPTTLDVMLNINESGALRTVVLTQKDTEQLMEKMMFDGLVERMRDASGNMNLREPRWRAKKRVWKVNMQQPHLQEFGHVEPEPGLLLPGNGLSQVPCARCPVKAKCKPGGVVNPEECKYLEDWLAF